LDRNPDAPRALHRIPFLVASANRRHPNMLGHATRNCQHLVSAYRGAASPRSAVLGTRKRLRSRRSFVTPGTGAMTLTPGEAPTSTEPSLFTSYSTGTLNRSAGGSPSTTLTSRYDVSPNRGSVVRRSISASSSDEYHSSVTISIGRSLPI